MIHLDYLHKKTSQPAKIIEIFPTLYLVEFPLAFHTCYFNKEVFEEEFEETRTPRKNIGLSR